MYKVSVIYLKEQVWRVLYNLLPLFLEKKNPAFIKMNSELIFFKIFTGIQNELVDDIIEKFILEFDDKNARLEISNISSVLLIDIYLSKKYNVTGKQHFDYSISIIENFEFTRKEVECYLSILSGKKKIR